MFKIQTLGVLVILLDSLPDVSCFTHWGLTNHGKIQFQMDSIFRLREPESLFGLLEQEERARHVIRLYKDLVERKNQIQANLTQWSSLERISQLETLLYSTDSDCLLAIKPLRDADLYTTVVEYAPSLDPKEMDIQEAKSEKNFDLDCAKFYPLDFSMTLFPHLKVLTQPWNISWVRESEIELPLTPSQIFGGLTRNKTSWYLYNLASLYWRKMGDSQRAIDCSKRAVHLASREFKDVPLLNLGVMLQRALCTAESAILLHSAIDHAPYKIAPHFVLGNTYAILEDYDRSVACYDNVLELSPEWSFVKRLKHAVICHRKLKQLSSQIQKSLEDIVAQLHEYHKLQKELLKVQDEIQNQQEPLKFPFASTIHNKRGDSCLPRIETDNYLSCDLSVDSSLLMPHQFNSDFTSSLQTLLKNVESQAQQISEKMPWEPFSRYSDSVLRKSQGLDPALLEMLIERSEDNGYG